MAPRPTILCVDDEPVVLNSLREQFRRSLGSEYAIEVAQDAEEALEIIHELDQAEHCLPVVISDHIMPGTKGDALLIAIHERLPHTRKILLTGQAGADAVGRVVNAGALYRYIAKPWDRADLELTVREAVRSFEADATLRQHQAELVEAHAASQRFIPHDFLHLIGRDRLVDVRRTDHSEREVSILFSDIRGFTTLVEDRSPAQNLAWINEYFERMERPVHANGGFVDSIEGDAIMALFGRCADDAVRAGIDSLSALAEYNAFRAQRGDPPLRMGIGVNTGPVLLGIVGGAERLKCGVVGDPVNLAARVEGLTRHLGTMLVTGLTRTALDDPDAYALRYVNRVVVKGRRGPTDLYEVLDGLPQDARSRRLETRDAAQQAIEHYQRGELAGAIEAFEALAAKDPDDGLFRWYLDRCRALQQQGLPPNWNGTTALERK